jgi:hypothetical protein
MCSACNLLLRLPHHIGCPPVVSPVLLHSLLLPSIYALLCLRNSRIYRYFFVVNFWAFLILIVSGRAALSRRVLIALLPFWLSTWFGMQFGVLSPLLWLPYDAFFFKSYVSLRFFLQCASISVFILRGSVNITLCALYPNYIGPLPFGWLWVVASSFRVQAWIRHIRILHAYYRYHWRPEF